MCFRDRTSHMTPHAPAIRGQEILAREALGAGYSVKHRPTPLLYHHRRMTVEGKGKGPYYYYSYYHY